MPDTHLRVSNIGDISEVHYTLDGMRAHPPVNYTARWLVIAVAALLSTPVGAVDVASCFNDSDSQGYIGIWAYEGVRDWTAARARVEVTPTFVCSFLPGR